MAAPPSRLERVVKLIGEENLPAKLPQPITQSESNNETATDPFSKLQTVDDFITQTESDNWWDFTPPTVPRPVKTTGTLQSMPVSTVSTDDAYQGELAPLGMSFSPFLAVTRFPYKFVSKNISQKLATAFFDGNKIYNREWDIYYVWSDYYPTAKPVTFVPEHQLLALVNEINAAFSDANINITTDLREEGLIIDFDECSELRPRWLSHSTSRAEYTSWTEGLTLRKQSQPTNDRSLQAFREKMELATEISKNKSKSRATRAKRQTDNLAKQQSLLRAQRYLGFLANTGEESQLPNIAAMSISRSPSPFNLDVVFIAVDVEAYERPPRYITEIGLATLDTRDLLNQVPGKVAESWQQYIRARHFRIDEYKHYVNSEFVQGCPSHFEFGKSEFIGKDSIGKELAKCFKSPYSGDSEVDEKRNIVLVGHDISQDINYLQQIGFNVLNSGSLIDKVDTSELFKVYKEDPNSRSLGNLLYEFDLTGWHLHNAGNDAVYTIWAMLAICKAASDRASNQAKEKVKDDGGGVLLLPNEVNKNISLDDKGKVED